MFDFSDAYMDEGGRDQNAGTEVLAGEENLGGDLDPSNLLRDHGESGSCRRYE
jgi:hypothetical protein